MNHTSYTRKNIMRPKGEVKEMSVVWGNWNDEQNQFHVTTENGIMR
jgi:hypothetical protein